MADTFRAPRPLLAFCLLAAFAATTTGQAKPSRGADGSRELASVKRYVARVDAYARREETRRRVFSNDSGEEIQGGWREIEVRRGEKSKSPEAFESASVWLRGGHVVLTRSVFQSPSGDWMQVVDYYFREDGTPAKALARLNTFHGNVTAVRERFYGSGGESLLEIERFYKLGTRRRIRAGAGRGDFMDEPIPMYKTVSELPFYNLLK